MNPEYESKIKKEDGYTTSYYGTVLNKNIIKKYIAKMKDFEEDPDPVPTKEDLAILENTNIDLVE